MARYATRRTAAAPKRTPNTANPSTTCGRNRKIESKIESSRRNTEKSFARQSEIAKKIEFEQNWINEFSLNFPFHYGELATPTPSADLFNFCNDRKMELNASIVAAVATTPSACEWIINHYKCSENSLWVFLLIWVSVQDTCARAYTYTPAHAHTLLQYCRHSNADRHRRIIHPSIFSLRQQSNQSDFFDLREGTWCNCPVLIYLDSRIEIRKKKIETHSKKDAILVEFCVDIDLIFALILKCSIIFCGV